MEVTAKLNRFRVAPRKARVVVDLIRGMDTDRARAQLAFSNKGVSEPILKLLDSAVANAKNVFSKQDASLYVKKVFVDQGPTYKRYRPRARGMVSPINKRTSHITIVLGERSLKQGTLKNTGEKKFQNKK